MVGWASVAVSNCFLVRENHRASHAAEVLFLKQGSSGCQIRPRGARARNKCPGKGSEKIGFFCWIPADKVWKYLMAYTPIKQLEAEHELKKGHLTEVRSLAFF